MSVRVNAAYILFDTRNAFLIIQGIISLIFVVGDGAWGKRVGLGPSR